MGRLVILAAVIAVTPAAARDDSVPEPAEEFGRTLTTMIEIANRKHVRRVLIAELSAAAVRGLYEAVREPVPTGIAARLAGRDDITKDRLPLLLADARRPLGQDTRLADGRDIDAAAEAVVRRLEPEAARSVLFRRDPLWMCDYRLGHGIGLTVESDPVDGSLRVRRTALDGPAYRAGLRDGDEVVYLLSEQPGNATPWRPVWPIPARAGDRESVLNGHEGSHVHVYYRRAGTPGLHRAVVRRETPFFDFNRETVYGVRRGGTDRWQFRFDDDPTTAYIRIRSFGPKTRGELESALRQVRAQRATALVLDLRLCRGGLLDAMVHSAEFFAGKRRLIAFRDREKEALAYDGESPPLWDGGPVACLIDGRTARAAELLAAVLQDHGLATVVGERTAGDTGIEHIMPVNDRWEFRYTAATMVGPGGRNLSRIIAAGRPGEPWGVRPDAGCEVPLTPFETHVLAQHLARLQCIDPPGGPRYALTWLADQQLDRAREVLRAKVAGR